MAVVAWAIVVLEPNGECSPAWLDCEGGGPLTGVRICSGGCMAVGDQVCDLKWDPHNEELIFICP